MKKLGLVVALVALWGLIGRTYADVQNIRLSGDIRVRGYYLLNAAENDTTVPTQWQNSSSFIAQRTRVSVEADLEDHVLAVVTLKAEGIWGASDQTSSAGAGTEDDAGSAINRSWSTGIDEAYVQFNEMFYSAATLKLGRQYLNYGRGLIISSSEQEYNFDAGRLVLDYYPLTIDLVGARVVDNGAFGGDSSFPSADLLFVNARYEMTDSALKAVEAYYGWVAQSGHGGVASTATQAPPTLNGASPQIIGGRVELGLTEGLNTSIEGAFEWGADGTGSANGDNIKAYIVQLASRYTFKDTAWSPSINFGTTFASGGGNSAGVNGSAFRPWFDYQDGYNGYLFCPTLSNIHIVNLGGTIKPYENTSLSVQGYFYRKMDHDSVAGSNANIDFGGLEFGREITQGNSDELGYEIDSILGYDYSKDVRLQLVYGAFVPKGAYTKSPTDNVSSVAQEVRAEVNVKF